MNETKRGPVPVGTLVQVQGLPHGAGVGWNGEYGIVVSKTHDPLIELHQDVELEDDNVLLVQILGGSLQDEFDNMLELNQDEIHILTDAERHVFLGSNQQVWVVLGLNKHGYVYCGGWFSDYNVARNKNPSQTKWVLGMTPKQYADQLDELFRNNV